MTGVYVHGLGGVSPAGWGVERLVAAVRSGLEPRGAVIELESGRGKRLVARVPVPDKRPQFLTHPRLRRSSPVSQYAVGAALEAVGLDATPERKSAAGEIAVILCVMSGSVVYSRRFYAEALADATAASPLIFPETVFNAPSSHVSAVLNSTAPNYTIVGDAGSYLAALALGAGWLEEGRVDGCVVIAAEEVDVLTANALGLFERRAIVSEGAGAIYLRREPGRVRLDLVTNPYSFTRRSEHQRALESVRADLGLGSEGDLLSDSRYQHSVEHSIESETWRDWKGPTLSVKNQLGEGLSATAAWQCVSAIERLKADATLRTASVSVLGLNQQAIGARFRKASDAA